MKQLRKMKMLSRTTLFLIVATLVFPFTTLSVMAQATTGGLTGSVMDASNAVIADADVTAKNVGTGIETKTKTNSDGIYNFPRLAPGIYLLTVEKQGFKRQEFQEVTINAGQVATIDANLQAGQITETVSVTAEGQELIQKEQVQVSSTFESRKVAELPKNAVGAGIDTLALLAPGVVPGFGNVNSNGATLSVNGNRARSNNFTIDGQDNNDLSIGGPNYFVNNNEIVAEFQVVTNNFSAEYGRNQGAIVNVVTKSGTNDLHGSLAWFHRDRKLFDTMNNLERRTNNQGKGEANPFLNNVYTGAVGGPIKKDRLFYFGSYQLVTNRQTANPGSNSPTIAPEELSRLKADFPNNGAIQALANFSAFALTDVGTVTENTDLKNFPNNERVTIGGRTYRLAYPVRTVPITSDQHQFSIRGDYRINDKHSFWYRHLYQTVDNVNALVSVDGSTGNQPASSNLGGLQFTSQLSNSAVNEFRFVFNRLDVIFGGGCESVKNCIPDPADIGNTVTRITYGGLISSLTSRSLLAIGPATNLPQGRIVSIYQFSDNFSKTLGRHQLRLGADVRRLTNTVPFLPNVNGSYAFNTGAAVASGTPSTLTVAAGTVQISYDETDQFYYVQDDWRIRDNLTLNIGARYEYTGQPINTLYNLTKDRESDPAQALWKQSLPLEARIFPKIPADKNNFAPRLGFAWRPGFTGLAGKLFGEGDSTVISGGYSIAYDPAFYNIMLNISTSAPGVFLNTLTSPSIGVPLNPVGSEVLAAASSLLQKNTFDPRFLAYTNVSGDFYSPYSQQYSLRWQREISRRNVVEVRYVATKGTGLFMTTNRNPRIDRLISGFTAPVVIGRVPITNAAITQNFTFKGFPNFVPLGVTPQTCTDNPATPDRDQDCQGRVLRQNVIRTRENGGSSIYHGLQSRWQANFSNRYMGNVNFGMSYSWSKALDNASEIFSFFEAIGAQDPFNIGRAERGYSGFDRKHSYSLNFIWDVPGFKDQQGVVGRVLGGWQFNGTYLLASGQRYTPQMNVNTFFFGNTYMDRTWEQTFLGVDTFRPFAGNLNAPRNAIGINQVDAALLFARFAAFVTSFIPIQDPNGFYSVNDLNNGKITVVTKDQVRYIVNGPGAAQVFNSPYGTATRGEEKGPKLNNLNLGLFKNIRINEGIRLQFRMEAFNALNHPNTGVGIIESGRVPPVNILTAGQRDGYGDFTAISFARRAVQMGLRLTF
ncbi:MAG: carboxypeptidase regulatory-like domain-containing protein [Acidobacteriota bacterium]